MTNCRRDPATRQASLPANVVVRSDRCGHLARGAAGIARGRNGRYTMNRVSPGLLARPSEVSSVCSNVLVGMPPNMVESPMSVSGLLKTRTQMRSVLPTLRM
jgi:hypothetical protein